MPIQIKLASLIGPHTIEGRSSVQVHKKQMVSDTYIRPLFRLFGEAEGILYLIARLQFKGNIQVQLLPALDLNGQMEFYNRDNMIMCHTFLHDLNITLNQILQVTENGTLCEFRAEITNTCVVTKVPERQNMS